MLQHLRANLWLLVLTLLLCSVIYPLILLGIGQTVFHDKAEGSLVYDGGRPIGSRLIAQPFMDKDGNPREEYFQPRPSAVSYKADASGASNWAASNYLLRDRVARQLGPIVTYAGAGKQGQRVGPDVETWFQDQAPAFVGRWAADHSSLAEQWLKDHTESAARWLGKEPDDLKKDTAESAKTFFALYSQKHPGTWPGEEEVKTRDEKTEKRIKPAREGSDVQSYLFEPWLQSHPDVELANVPADMVMASGSGLDPHITRKNAAYQLPGVVAAWANKTHRDAGTIRVDIEALLKEKTEAPLGGLVGVDLVNVFELNRALKSHAERHWLKSEGR